MAQKLVVGCGYLGGRVARLWQDAGDEVYVLTRSLRRARQFAADGFRPVVGDVTQPQSLSDLPAHVETTLYSVGLDRTSGRSMSEVYVDGLKNVLGRHSAIGGKFIYISSTGVYGQHDESWVDETTPCRPERAGGITCLAAEDVLRAERPAIILRLAGIYGPGRLPRLDDVLHNRPMAADPEGWLNLIHVDDTAKVVLAVEAQTQPPALYLVSDGHPVMRRMFYEDLARLLDAPRPIFSHPSAARSELSRHSSCKRISNRRMLDDLKIELEFPSFREGLAQIVAGR